MKQRSCIILIALVTSLSVFSQTKKKAVFIIVDGTPADVIEKVNTPALDSIALSGGYARPMWVAKKMGIRKPLPSPPWVIIVYSPVPG